MLLQNNLPVSKFPDPYEPCVIYKEIIFLRMIYICYLRLFLLKFLRDLRFQKPNFSKPMWLKRKTHLHFTLNYRSHKSLWATIESNLCSILSKMIGFQNQIYLLCHIATKKGHWFAIYRGLTYWQVIIICYWR